MRTKMTWVMVTAGSLLTATGPVGGQEVNSDVSIPVPREIATTIPAASGLFTGPGSSEVQGFEGALADATVGTSNEAEARAELGDFMASLLIKAGVIAVQPGPARLSASDEKSKDGSWPAWTGRTPMELSVSRTGRSEARRR